MSQTSSNPATLRLPFKEKLAYGLGDLGSNILLDIGTLYLLKFYTDVLGLPGTYGGIIFLIAKFFTAFTDMGTCNFAFFSGLIGAQFWAERAQPKSPELDAKLLVSC